MQLGRIGRIGVSTAAAFAAAVAVASPSEAASDGIVATVGSCDPLFHGPSTDGTSTSYHVVGAAVAITTRPVVSVELHCSLREANGATVGTLVGTSVGNASVVAGDIPVNAVGPFSMCTMVNVHFVDGGETNPNQVFECHWIQPLLG